MGFFLSFSCIYLLPLLRPYLRDYVGLRPSNYTIRERCFFSCRYIAFPLLFLNLKFVQASIYFQDLFKYQFDLITINAIFGSLASRIQRVSIMSLCLYFSLGFNVHNSSSQVQ